jgi:hypothetical protein
MNEKAGFNAKVVLVQPRGGHPEAADRFGEQDGLYTLNLLSGPGNDLVSATDLTAAGAHMILYTTGRGTPFGAPAPTVKISTNTALFEKKGNWIDFNAGSVAEGEPLDAAWTMCWLWRAGRRPVRSCTARVRSPFSKMA